LAANRFVATAEPTIADIACYADAAFARLGLVDLSPWPHVGDWSTRIEGLPGFGPPLDLVPMADAELGAVC